MANNLDLKTAGREDSTDKAEAGLGRFSSDGSEQQGTNEEINARKTLWKIDARLLPILSIVYLFAFLDRSNIGNANVFGLSSDLDLSGSQYSTALCIFFIPYILFEVPSNALLKKFKPHLFLGVCIGLFGVVSLCQGFVTNYAGLLATRFLLGLFEAGIFPGCFYLLAMWYKREESQKRFTFFFLSTVLAGAFGGLLASAIGKMDGMAGKNAWRWIFIIEGGATVLVGVLAYFTIPDFPEDVKWLTPSEKHWLKARLEADVGNSGRATKAPGFRDLKIIFTDYKFFTCAIMYFGFLIPAYGFAYFAPSIVQAGKYSPITTQLRTVPVWIVAWVVSMIFSILSDRIRHRFLFVVAGTVIGIVGFIVLLTVHGRTDIQYGALFLALTGAFAVTPICICWFTTNIAGHTRRSIGSAFQIAFGNLGGIVATFVFIKEEAPTYRTGYGVCLAGLCIALVSSVVFYLGITKENRDRAAGKAGVVRTEDADEDLGDLARDFRYMR